MEPVIGVNFAHFLPYGSGQFNSGNRLLGTFGSATLEGVSDYYSQLIYKVCFFAKVLPCFLFGCHIRIGRACLVFPSSLHLSNLPSSIYTLVQLKG